MEVVWINNRTSFRLRSWIAIPHLRCSPNTSAQWHSCHPLPENWKHRKPRCVFANRRRCNVIRESSLESCSVLCLTLVVLYSSVCTTGSIGAFGEWRHRSSNSLFVRRFGLSCGCRAFRLQMLHRVSGVDASLHHCCSSSTGPDWRLSRSSGRAAFAFVGLKRRRWWVRGHRARSPGLVLFGSNSVRKAAITEVRSQGFS